ncbi:unnamed protein product [Didymodactylos carnosus]|uniref:Uncharacterized protein n=1 Tax=Didymodactylos carnosus TaxID=1234261 RepID=A0A8S2EDT7_9BILA|nr:unnamed protein product [Didymodactylos carnosus]CAF3893739.1 unnamed protein product [Didymodactylos carnosus]
MPTGIDSLSHQQHLHHHHNYNYRPPHHYKSTIHLVTTARDFNDEDERRRSSSYKVNNEINSSNIANYIKNQSNSSHAYSQQYHSSLSHRPVNNTYSSTRTNSSLSRHSSNLTKTTAAAALAMLLKGHADTSSSSNLLDITDQQQTRATPNRRRGSIITDSILTKNDQCKQQTKSSYSSLVTLNRTNQTVSTQVAAPSIRRCVSVLGKRYSSTDLNIPKPNTARVEKSSSLRSTNQDLNERETLNNSKSRISLDSNGSLSARISNYQQQLPLNMRRNHVLSQSKSNSSMILNDSAMNKMKGERLHDTSLTQSNSENTIKANEQEYVKNSGNY